jgi:hypothetical protein
VLAGIAGVLVVEAADGLPPCSSEYAWRAEPCTPNDLNALPVIEFEWDC